MKLQANGLAIEVEDTGPLGIAQAHVVGASMGGMIAQRMALAAPQRVLTLTSIMSSSGARFLPGPHPRVLQVLLSRPKDHSEPTLVLHGADDPLVPLACGEDTARRIPGARLVAIPGMGHDLPPGVVDRLLDPLLPHLALRSEP